jgi:hypothetical protein
MSDVLVSQPLHAAALSSGRVWFLRNRRGLMLALLVAMFIVTALAPRIFITIPSGHGGILWLRFFGGTQAERSALGEGLHVIPPWDHIFIYDMRVQEHDQAYEVIAREGLQVTVRSSFRWHLNPGNAAASAQADRTELSRSPAGAGSRVGFARTYFSVRNRGAVLVAQNADPG